MMYLYAGKNISNRPFTSADGTFHPAGWVEGATPEQLAEIGVTVAPDIPEPDYDTATQRIEQQDDGSWLVIDLPPAPIADVNPRQIRMALTRAGLRSAVEAAVLAGDQDIKDWWEFSQYYERGHPQVVVMAAALGVPDAQLDALWLLAATL